MHEQLSDIHEVRKNLHVFQLFIKEKENQHHENSMDIIFRYVVVFQWAAVMKYTICGTREQRCFSFSKSLYCLYDICMRKRDAPSVSPLEVSPCYRVCVELLSSSTL